MNFFVRSKLSLPDQVELNLCIFTGVINLIHFFTGSKNLKIVLTEVFTGSGLTGSLTQCVFFIILLYLTHFVILGTNIK